MNLFQRLRRRLFGACYFPSCDCRIELDEPMKCMPAGHKAFQYKQGRTRSVKAVRIKAESPAALNEGASQPK